MSEQAVVVNKATTTATATATTNKSIDDMDGKELIAEATKELQEIKMLLGISSKEEENEKK
jgi:hypothetical protein